MGRKSEGKVADQSMAEEDGKVSYEDKLKNVSIIAKPMASKKLTKKVRKKEKKNSKYYFALNPFLFQLYKCIKKGAKQKNLIRNGLKDVQSQIRKGATGLVVFAGDVTPIEVMCHLPAVCEEKGIPYIYTPSRYLLLNQANGINFS